MRVSKGNGIQDTHGEADLSREHHQLAHNHRQEEECVDEQMW